MTVEWLRIRGAGERGAGLLGFMWDSGYSRIHSIEDNRHTFDHIFIKYRLNTSSPSING